MNYQYKTECSLSNLKNIRAFTRNSLKDQDIPDLILNAIILAIDEICSNLIIHAHHCNPNDSIELHIVRPSKKILIFELIDDKTLFNIHAFNALDLINLLQERKKGGLGIRLIKFVMNKIEYDSRGEKNVYRFIKEI